MKTGADRKKVIILGALGLVAAYVLWTNVFSGSVSSSGPSRPRPVSAGPVAAIQPGKSDAERVMSRRTGSPHSGNDFHPNYKDKPVDPLTVDPTLRLDLLARVQKEDVNPAAQRDIFNWGDAPKPVDTKPLPTVHPITIGPGGKLAGTTVPGPATPAPPAGPPPIALKYYGYSTPKTSGHKRAFFLDGEDIIVASEGDMVKRRYKLVKIGVNSVTVEDTQFNNNQQTLPLAPDIAS